MKAYRREKVSFKDYLFAMAGIKQPWLFLALALAATIASTFATMNIATFNGTVVDELGNVPTEKIVKYASSYLVIALASAATLVLSAIASEKINLGLRSRLWKKIIYTRQSCYDMDGGETLVSRVTTDCDFATIISSNILFYLLCPIRFISLDSIFFVNPVVSMPELSINENSYVEPLNCNIRTSGQFSIILSISISFVPQRFC